jgi:hypothetical protein
VARPVTIDRTCPVACGCLLETIGRWHCGVRFVKRVRSVEVSRARAVRDLRVRSVEQRVRSLDDYWGAELTVEILRLSFEEEDTWTATGDRSQCSASGHIDRHVRSLRKSPNKGVTALFVREAINTYGGRPWSGAEHTLALVGYVVVLGSPITHSCLIVFIGSSERAILVRLHCEIASSGTR